jgi:hypothetical protein
VRVAFISGGRARPVPKPLRIAMKADHDLLAVAEQAREGSITAIWPRAAVLTRR